MGSKLRVAADLCYKHGTYFADLMFDVLDFVRFDFVKHIGMNAGQNKS